MGLHRRGRRLKEEPPVGFHQTRRRYIEMRTSDELPTDGNEMEVKKLSEMSTKTIMW